jgi:polyhydroxybutyrate depolymerase
MKIVGITLVFILFFALASVASDTLTLTLPSGRSALFEKGNANGKALPILIVFHGGGQSGQSIRSMSKIGEQDLSRQFHILYPNAASSAWNDGRLNFNSNAFPNDVAFVDSLLSLTKDRFADADTNALYLCGISSGGLFCFHYAQQRPQKVKGIAVVAATILKDLTHSPAPSGIPLLMLNGTSDPIMPYEGGAISSQKVSVLSNKGCAAYWLGFKSATELSQGTMDTLTIQEEEMVLTRSSWSNKESKVTLLSFIGAGHTWPGGPQFASVTNVGRVCKSYNGSKAILEFFLP